MGLDSLKKGGKALRLQKKLRKEGKLDIRLIEDFLNEQGDEDSMDDLSFLAEMINHELDQLESLCDKAGLDHPEVGRFDMEEMRDLYERAPWLKATKLIASQYSEEKGKLIECLGRELGLDESDISELK